jgi:hypothetical protein
MSTGKLFKKIKKIVKFHREGKKVPDLTRFRIHNKEDCHEHFPDVAVDVPHSYYQAVRMALCLSAPASHRGGPGSINGRDI